MNSNQRRDIEGIRRATPDGMRSEIERLKARTAELEAEVERLREEADPPRCGNCSLRGSEECRRSISEWDEPCDEYVRDVALLSAFPPPPDPEAAP